jgi:PPK2 family polyphosphate:nucleotide phosphotransferase
VANASDRLAKRLAVKPGKRVRLSQWDPNDTNGYHGKAHCEAVVQRNVKQLFDLQTLLAACNGYAVLIVLQGMDAAGKDGTIRHVMTGLNPQGCTVTSFKVPTDEESKHGYLWRVHKAAPKLGEIGIFNRSHYEDVLVARVHRLVPKSVWSARFEQINDFEKILAANRTMILKFFLHISREEQLRRLEQRIEDPTKNWKISPADFQEREYWDDYVAAYEDALGKCSTESGPWYIVPSDRKWFRNLAVSQIIVERMAELKMKYPPAAFDVAQLREALRAKAGGATK